MIHDLDDSVTFVLWVLAFLKVNVIMIYIFHQDIVKIHEIISHHVAHEGKDNGYSFSRLTSSSVSVFSFTPLLLYILPDLGEIRKKNNYLIRLKST